MGAGRQGRNGAQSDEVEIKSEKECAITVYGKFQNKKCGLGNVGLVSSMEMQSPAAYHM